MRSAQEKKTKSNKDRRKKNFSEASLLDFDYIESKAWTKLASKYGSKVNFDELLRLAEILSNHLNIQLSRCYKRRKEMLIKWYDDNLNTLWPYIEGHITVTLTNGRII